MYQKATSASSFSGVQGSPAGLHLYTQTRCHVLQSWSLIGSFYIFSRMLSRIHRTPSRKRRNYLRRTATTCDRYQTCLIHATSVACDGKLHRCPPRTVQSKERFDAISIACVENCMLSQRSAAGLNFGNIVHIMVAVTQLETKS